MNDTSRREDEIDAPASLALVHEQDRDRSLAMPFVPTEKKGAWAALHAFDIETARIRDLVSQPLPGEIRLQWWRDLISGGGSGGSGHPIADELLATIDRHDLPRAAFERFLEARIFDLYDDPFPSTGDLEGYAGETQSTLIMLSASILSPEDARAVSDAAGHAGVAVLVASLLRRLPVHLRRGWCPVPLDLLVAAGCTQEDFLRANAEPSSRAVSVFCAFGREHDARWRAHLADLPKPLRAAFLPASLASSYIDAAEKLGPGLRNGPVEIGPVGKTWRYWRTMRS
ncbi:squalene/phytoene synthase family protein [Fulvimarina endophytica]|uniref:Squalene/phytoene synthase family protein n=1 Tax=Fulvimarina endophytica TaxID=2293836 RepID=A0A371XAX3_9HYPH|nr:squalene/phytoene synthase family protein [Fulvimarina endophytica]RFC66359.1 squalene/phytoene synthase family protein [Fulvimarina endophytica]